MNQRREPLNDPRVRQAFNLAFHRQAIRDVVGHPDVGAIAPPITGIRAAGPWGRTAEEISELPGYRELNGEKHPDDIAAARKLLAEAGYPNGFTITYLATPVERPGAVPLFTDQLKEYLNVTLETETVDLATMARRIDARDMDLWVDTSPPLIVAPDNWLWQAYMPVSGTAKASGWEAPQWFQDAVQDQAQEPDPEKRLAKIREIEDFLMNEDPGSWVVLFWEARHMIANDRVKGFNMPAISVSQLKFEHIWCDPC
jgi:peptide/nickel transport system substrate-binding protein